MAYKTLILLCLLLCAVAGFAQTPSIQLDSQQASDLQQAPGADAVPTTPKDAQLVTTPPVASSEQQQFDQVVKDIHFDFDKAELRPEDQQILQSDAAWLKAHPDVLVTLEGDADERGDIVYNVVLSGERAETAKNALIQMGVRPDQIAFATGWGKLYPVCTEADENCWSQNRRTHFATWPPEEQGTQLAITLAP